MSAAESGPLGLATPSQPDRGAYLDEFRRVSLAHRETARRIRAMPPWAGIITWWRGRHELVTWLEREADMIDAAGADATRQEADLRATRLALDAIVADAREQAEIAERQAQWRAGGELVRLGKRGMPEPMDRRRDGS